MSSRRNDDGSRNNGTSNSDDPPMSRKNSKRFFWLTQPINGIVEFQWSLYVFSGLFIICNKQNTEEDFREAFQKFGKIEEIYTIKDRNTGDSKGKQCGLFYKSFAFLMFYCWFSFTCSTRRCSLH